MISRPIRGAVRTNHTWMRKYRIPSGSTIRINQGVLLDIMISVPMTTNVHHTNDLMFIGIVISITSMSFVNL